MSVHGCAFLLHACAYMHVHVCAYACRAAACMCMCVHACECVCMHVHVCTCMYMSVQCCCVHLHECAVLVHVCARMYMRDGARVSRPRVCPRVQGVSAPPCCSSSLPMCTAACVCVRTPAACERSPTRVGAELRGGGVPGRGCPGGSVAGATGLRRLGCPSPGGSAAGPQTGRTEAPGSSPEVLGVLPLALHPDTPRGMTLG